MPLKRSFLAIVIIYSFSDYTGIRCCLLSLHALGLRVGDHDSTCEHDPRFKREAEDDSHQ